MSYDQFHANKDRIYEAWNKAAFSGELHAWNTTPKVLTHYTGARYTEVETISEGKTGLATSSLVLAKKNNS